MSFCCSFEVFFLGTLGVVAVMGAKVVVLVFVVCLLFCPNRGPEQRVRFQRVLAFVEGVKKRAAWGVSLHFPQCVLLQTLSP